MVVRTSGLVCTNFEREHQRTFANGYLFTNHRQRFFLGTLGTVPFDFPFDLMGHKSESKRTVPIDFTKANQKEPSLLILKRTVPFDFPPVLDLMTISLHFSTKYFVVCFMQLF
jgi:hypothetical protein